MDEATHRWRRPDDGRLQRPVAHLVCNFAPPGQGRPSLLSHDDVITLFHEFGHGLHHLLTQVDELSLSGIAGVEWDAAELPSQFMENFCWEWPVLQRLSGHVDTGEPLPRDLFDRLQGARDFGGALRLLRHVELALFDMRLHTEPARRRLGAGDRGRRAARGCRCSTTPPASPTRTASRTSSMAAMPPATTATPGPRCCRPTPSSAFEEHGLFDADTGRRWREAVLEIGGSRPALRQLRGLPRHASPA